MDNTENKRLIQAYTSKIVLNWMIFLWLFIFALVNIPSMYDEYDINKNTLLSSVWAYETLEKDGLSYQELLTMISDNQTKLFVTKVWEKFYVSNFKNTTNWTYIDFLKKKEENINSLKKSNIVMLRDQKISKILPSYQEWVAIDGVMSDLEFVNHVEKLLRMFNLKTTSNIWINQVIPYQDTQSKNIDSLSSQIFYIPLTLDLEGNKWNVINFLYYLQNVWKIESVTQNDIKLYSDNVINTDLNWDNIYHIKMVDAENVKFSTYFDTSSELRNSAAKKSVLWMLSLVREWVEKNDLYNISVNLRFYIKGMPLYKLESYVLEISKSYKNLKKDVDALVNQYSSKNLNNQPNVLWVLSNLRNIQTYLQWLDQRVKLLENALKQKSNLEKLYTDASKIAYDIENLNQVFLENQQKLKLLNNKK